MYFEFLGSVIKSRVAVCPNATCVDIEVNRVSWGKCCAKTDTVIRSVFSIHRELMVIAVFAIVTDRLFYVDVQAL